jgi:hypothetical protein
MKKVSGQRFQLDVLEKLGLPVTDAMHTRFAQIDAERDSKRDFSTRTPRKISSGCLERRIGSTRRGWTRHLTARVWLCS